MNPNFYVEKNLFIHNVKFKVAYYRLVTKIFVQGWEDELFENYLQKTKISKPFYLKFNFETIQTIKQNFEQTPQEILRKLPLNSIKLEEIQVIVKRLRKKNQYQDIDLISKLSLKKSIIGTYEEQDHFVYVFKNIKNYEIIKDMILEVKDLFMTVCFGLDGVFKLTPLKLPIYFIGSITTELHAIPMYVFYLSTNTTKLLKKGMEFVLEDLKKEFKEDFINYIIFMIDKELSSIKMFNELNLKYLLCYFHSIMTWTEEIKKKSQEENRIMILGLLITMRNSKTENEFKENYNEFKDFCEDNSEEDFLNYFNNEWKSQWKSWTNIERSMVISIFNTNNILEFIIKSFGSFNKFKKQNPLKIIYIIDQFLSQYNIVNVKKRTKSYKELDSKRIESLNIPQDQLEKMINPIDKINDKISKEWLDYRFQIKSFTNKNVYETSVNHCTCSYYLSNGKNCKHQFLLLRYFNEFKNHKIPYSDNALMLIMNSYKYYNFLQLHKTLRESKFFGRRNTEKTRHKKKNLMVEYKENLYTKRTEFELDSILSCIFYKRILIIKIQWTHSNATYDLYNSSYKEAVREVIFLKLNIVHHKFKKKS